MKKMKKIIATLVCLVVAIATLSACTGGTGNNNKPTQEPNKPTEVVTSEPTQEPDRPTEVVTSEPTTEPTVTAEPTTEPPTGDVIIPLYSSTCTLDEIKQVSIADLFQYYNFALYFNPVTTDKFTENGLPLYQLNAGNTFQMINPADTESTPVNVEIYFFFDEVTGNNVNLYYIIDGTNNSMPFLPILYNQSKGCFVGYNDSGTLTELYYSPDFGGMCTLPVDDPSVYGF